MKKFKFKKVILPVIAIIGVMFALTACREVDRVTYNISQQADNFNVVRRLTVINSRTDKPEFELIGNFSLQVDNVENQLEVICETGKNEYKKHFIGLNEWTMYVVEDIGGAEIDKYHYEVNFLPEMINPITFTSND